MRQRVRELADGRLVDAVAAGDDRAAGEFCRRHHEAVRRYALSILHHREDAEDVAQAVMARALDAIPRHRPRRLRPWLLTITRNEALTLLRARVPREALSPDLAAAGSVDGAFALREEVEGLVVDLRALPERQRTALVLRQLYELSYRDIGELLGVRPGSAREAVLEARRSLLTRAQGRAQDCGDIRLLLRDGRSRRAVLVRAHLDGCASCRAAFQPSLAGRLKGLLPVPEPLLPPIVLRLLAGPGAGVRTGGGVSAACLCAVIGFGVVGDVRRGDDGPPRSSAPRAQAQQPPDRAGGPAVTRAASGERARRGARAGARTRSRATGVAPRRTAPPAAAPAPRPFIALKRPSGGESSAPAVAPEHPERQADVEVHVPGDGSAQVYTPPLDPLLQPLNPPEELPVPVCGPTSTPCRSAVLPTGIPTSFAP